AARACDAARAIRGESVGVQLRGDASPEGVRWLSAIIFSVTPPDETCRAVFGGLQKRAPDRLRQRRIVELDTEVGFLGALSRSAPGGADLGCSSENAKVRGSLAFLAVVGDKAHLCRNGERANGAGIAVLDGRERSNHGHEYLLLADSVDRGHRSTIASHLAWLRTVRERLQSARGLVREGCCAPGRAVDEHDRRGRVGDARAFDKQGLINRDG